MALAEKRGHRFGFTTREIDDANRGRIVLEHSSGKLIVGTHKLGDREALINESEPNGKIFEVVNSLERPVTRCNEKEANYGKVKTNPVLYRQPTDFLPKNQSTGDFQACSIFQLTQNHTSDSLNLAREKSVSIPKSHFRDGLQSIVVRKQLYPKDPDTTTGDMFTRKPHYIRTTYQECDGDCDAMHVSIQSAISSDETHQQIQGNSIKKRPTCRRWTRKRSKGTTLDKSTISITGRSGCAINGHVEETENPALISPTRKDLPKHLPMIDGKKLTTCSSMDNSTFHPHGNILLRKSWRLAISRTPSNAGNASDVYVSGINIHPVCSDESKVLMTKSEPPCHLEEKKDIDSTKSVELLQLSVPVFQKKIWRGSPLLRWDEQQQMVALGRPKSVNERFVKHTGRSRAVDRQKMPGSLSCSNRPTLPDTKLSDKSGSISTELKGSDTLQISLDKQDSLESSGHTNRPKDICSKAAITQQLVSRGTSPSKYSSIGSDYDTFSVHKWDSHLTDTDEPSLYLKGMSPKMQGPTSNVLDQYPNNRSDTSVQKQEKGARFKICKPMFDKEDYEDFQHKKFKKGTGKSKCNRTRNPADSIHYLRVQIGEF